MKQRLYYICIAVMLTYLWLLSACHTPQYGMNVEQQTVIPSDFKYSDGILFIHGENEMEQWKQERGEWDDKTELWGIESKYGTVKTIIITEGVTTILDDAFWGCTSVKEIILPKSVKYIGEWAFSRCKALEFIYLPQGLNTIGGFAFDECVSLRQISVPNSVTEIGICAFSGCCSLQEVIISSGLRTMSESIFAGCTSLTELRIPQSVQMIDYGAIGGRNLRRVVFEGTVEHVVDLHLRSFPRISQLVFLDGPPLEYGPGEDEESRGITFGSDTLPHIYYLREKMNLWAPNGETEWNGCPLVAINSLDDLPPLD